MNHYVLMAVLALPTVSLASAQEPVPGDAPAAPAAEAPPAPVAGTPVSEEPSTEAPPPPEAPVRPAPSFAEAQEQYELRHIGFDDFVAVPTSSLATYTTPVARWSVPYEGKYRKPLEGEAFYQKVGRADLVEAYQGRMRTKAVIGLAGGATLLAGGIVLFSGISRNTEDCDAFSPGFGACMDRNQRSFDSGRSRAQLGAVIAAAGTGLLFYAFMRDAHPVTASEARELADVYNKQLRTELGLSDEPAPAPTPLQRKRPNVIQASLTPAVGPGGGGLLLNAVF